MSADGGETTFLAQRPDILQEELPEPPAGLGCLLAQVVCDGPARNVVVAGQGELKAVVPEETVMDVVLGHEDELLVPGVVDVRLREQDFRKALAASARCLA